MFLSGEMIDDSLRRIYRERQSWVRKQIKRDHKRSFILTIPTVYSEDHPWVFQEDFLGDEDG